MVLELREYQKEAVDAFFNFVTYQNGRSGVIAAPTGSGKSLIISDICKTMITKWPHTKVVIATHRKELIAQNEKELKAYYPKSRTGIYSAGLGRREKEPPIIFCGIQTVYKRAFSFGRVDLLIIDEAHLVSTTDGTRYMQFISDLMIANPNLVILGLSATPYRLDNGLIYGNDPELIFKTLIYDIDIADLIAQGYLVPAISKGALKQIDLTGVRTTAGDYNNKDLQKAASEDELVRSSVEEVIRCGQNRHSWLVFCTGIRHAQMVCHEMRERGIDCEVVIADTPGRDQILERFKRQQLRCIINIDVLTTGFNAPCTDLIALMMATKSTAKYVQAVGRGLRTSPGKENCLLLDFGGNVIAHGPIDAVDPKSQGKSKKKDKEDVPGKQCPNCQEVIAIGSMVCPRCEYQFPPREIYHETQAYDGSVLCSQDVPKWYDVIEVEYTRHPGKGEKPDTIKCAYYTKQQFQPFLQWIAPDHEGFPKKKALEYIRQCGGKAETVDHALKENVYWKDPSKILVGRDPKNKKYMRVFQFDFSPKEIQESII